MGKLTLKKLNLIEVAQIGVDFGRVVEAARRYPMETTKMEGLLERMKPYRAIFEPYVQGANAELNRLHPLPDGKPRFSYEIPR